jgi:hypothetical protein
VTERFTPSVLTANDLLEGDVVYLAASGHWTRRLPEARLFTDPDSAALALAAAQAQPGRLVGAYLAPARLGPHGPEATHFREAFRARGPSNYPHGKQAEGKC